MSLLLLSKAKGDYVPFLVLLFFVALFVCFCSLLFSFWGAVLGCIELQQQRQRNIKTLFARINSISLWGWVWAVWQSNGKRQSYEGAVGGAKPPPTEQTEAKNEQKNYFPKQTLSFVLLSLSQNHRSFCFSCAFLDAPKRRTST